MRNLNASALKFLPVAIILVLNLYFMDLMAGICPDAGAARCELPCGRRDAWVGDPWLGRTRSAYGLDAPLVPHLPEPERGVSGRPRCQPVARQREHVHDGKLHRRDRGAGHVVHLQNSGRLRRRRHNLSQPLQRSDCDDAGRANTCTDGRKGAAYAPGCGAAQILLD